MPIPIEVQTANSKRNWTYTNMPKEIWKNITNFPGYQVSNFGRIKSLDRIVVGKNGRRFPKKGIVREQVLSKKGYYQVCLGRNGKSFTVESHRIIAEAFIPVHCRGKLEVNHKDGNKENNKINNLEWVTHKDNVRHAFKLGLIFRARGDAHHNVKLTDRNVLQVKKLYASGFYSQDKLSIIFRVTQPAISYAIRKR